MAFIVDAQGTAVKIKIIDSRIKVEDPLEQKFLERSGFKLASPRKEQIPIYPQMVRQDLDS